MTRVSVEVAQSREKMMVEGKGRFLGKLEEEQGAIIALVAFMMIGLLGFMALAVDLGHLYMVKNELQNAADAGALAGASVLYNDNATQVNAGANQVAYDTATANRASIFPSGWSPVQVNWTAGTNTGDVERGHYDYSSGVFTANASLNPPSATDLRWGNETGLNVDTNFVNAVRVVTRTTTGSLFANFFGVTSSDLRAEAIAYVGFAKELYPRDADQPIAICQDWLNGSACINWPNNNYRMVPDSGGQIARWITLNEGSDPQSDISCLSSGEPSVGNTQVMPFNDPMNIMVINAGGSADVPFNRFRSYWNGTSALGRCAMNDSNNDGIRDAYIDPNNNNIPNRPWVLALPVINCSGNPPSTAPLGRVIVEIIWITPDPGWDVCAGTPGFMNDGPSGIDWSCSGPWCGDPSYRWYLLANQFRFRDSDNIGAPILNDCTVPTLHSKMFIKPVCDTVNGTLQPVRPLTGSTGSQIYGQRGQLAKYPVLVK